MTIRYVGEGKVLEYNNAGTAISAGDVVVLTGMIGIALEDIPATTGVGSVAIEGVFEIAGVTGAAITEGQQVLWDSSASKVDDAAATPASGDFMCGMAMETIASVAAGAFVNVNINKHQTAVT